MHVTRYRQRSSHWITIKVNEETLLNFNNYIHESFALGIHGDKVIREGQVYSSIDDFYKAKRNYFCLNTCNSWVNTGFQKGGLKSCYSTPFDFGLMRKHTDMKSKNRILRL